MPCWTIQTTQVELGKLNRDLLKAAMRDLGFASYQYDGNTVTVRGDLDLNAVRRAYSRQVVISQAKRFGWQFKETAENQFEVVKASRI